MIHIYTSHNAFSFRLTALTALLVTAMTFLPQSLRAQNPTITTTFTGATRNNYDQIFLDYTSTPEGFDWDYAMSIRSRKRSFRKYTSRLNDHR